MRPHFTSDKQSIPVSATLPLVLGRFASEADDNGGLSGLSVTMTPSLESLPRFAPERKGSLKVNGSSN